MLQDRVIRKHMNIVMLRIRRATDSTTSPISCLWEWWIQSDHSIGPDFVFAVDRDRCVLQRYAAVGSNNLSGDYGLPSFRAGGATLMLMGSLWEKLKLRSLAVHNRAAIHNADITAK